MIKLFVVEAYRNCFFEVDPVCGIQIQMRPIGVIAYSPQAKKKTVVDDRGQGIISMRAAKGSFTAKLYENYAQG